MNNRCSFHAVIHQLTKPENKPKLEKLLTDYQKDGYRTFKTEFREKVINFINKLVEKNSAILDNHVLVEDLVNLVVLFVEHHGEIITFQCNNLDGNEGKGDNHTFYQKIKTEFMSDSGGSSVDDLMLDTNKQITAFFREKYIEDKVMGGDTTLSIIELIFNCVIYKWRFPDGNLKLDSISLVESNPPRPFIKDEEKEKICNQTGLIELDLLYHSMHYNSLTN